jgi:RimJ/RimL family protein N-acetyltransferase
MAEQPYIPGPAYRILTPRLVLRCWEPSDASQRKTTVDANIQHLLPWLPWAADHPQELQDHIDHIRSWRAKFDSDQDFVYGVFSNEDGRVLGSSGLHLRHRSRDEREIGYWIHKDYVNQGLATELSAALTRVAFEVDRVQRVEIQCLPENVFSAAVPRKLGYIHEATLQKRVPLLDNTLGDNMIWTMFAEDYPDSPAASLPIEAFDAIGRKLL